ncbi:hypothetical protein QVA66_10470 [Staphylococcus chromogenes]|nr:hypothetical protein [Staphylococcus chromogenes]
MDYHETAHWISDLFPGEMQVGSLGPCQLATFGAGAEHIACTLNASAVDTGVRAGELDVRSEIFTVASKAAEAPVLVAGAYQMLVDAAGRIPARPGEVLPGLATLCRRFDLTARHGVFTVPFVWGAEVPQFTEVGRQTLMLQLIMLTDQEFVYLKTYGLAALQEELVRAEVNIQDLYRK